MRAPILLAILLVSAEAGAQSAPAGALGPTVVKLPDGPGSVAGLADPATIEGFDAQVGYSVPIQVPETGGLWPRLALVYSGGLGNGPMGVGWTLQVPAIRRSLRQGVPDYDGGDELVIEGIGASGRLVAAGDDRWLVEGQGQSIQVRRVGGRFEVWDADGVHYVLGQTAAARLADGGRTAAWLAEWVFDTGGDRIAFTWRHDGGDVYLERVEWGEGAFAVEAGWEARSDRVVSWRAGFAVTTALRLAELRVISAGRRLRTYELAYAPDGEHPLSRLAEVRVTGLDGEGELPRLRFGYAAAAAASVTEVPGAGGWYLDARGVTLADVDGDGVQDLLRLEMGNHAWRRNLGGALGEERPLAGAAQVELAGARLLDLDGDARVELVRVVDDSWRVYRLEGETWVAAGEWAGTGGLPLGGPGTAFADLDGDGRTDVVQATGAGLLVSFGTDGGMAGAVQRPPVSSVDPPVEPGAPNVRLLDMNGDGLADVVWLTDAWTKVFLGRGDGTFAIFDRVFWPWGPGTTELAGVELVDLDRDGLVDVVRPVAGNLLWYRGTGDHRFHGTPRHVARPEAALPDVRVTSGDLDGNGSDDLVWSSPRGLWVLDLAGPISAGMLETIDDGLGRVTRFSYSSSGELSLAAEAAGEPWIRKLPVSIPVPVGIEITFADGSPARVAEHTVRDGFWDGAERRFGGFLEARRVVPAGGGSPARTEVTRFHAGLGAERVLRGLVWHTRRESGGVVLDAAETTWEARCVGGVPCSSPLLRKAARRTERTWAWEGVTEPIETRADYEFDDQARVVVERDQGRLDLSGDERVVRREWVSFDGIHVRDRVADERVEEWDGRLVARTHTTYEAHGRPVLTQGWLAEEARWIDLEERGYDGRGNIVEQTTGGVTRTVEWDGSGLYPVAETVAGLTWRLEWDPVLGQPTALTDPNGDVTEMTYDTLGRPSTVALNGGAPHAGWAYEWSGPRPRTHAYVLDDGGWRETVTAANGAGEAQYEATRLGPARWIVAGWRVRDGRGRVTALAQPFYADGEAPPAELPAGVPVETLRYDAYDRPVEQLLPTGARKQVAYAAFCATSTVAGLAPVSSCSDGQDRVISTERTVGEREWVEASYDAAGRLLSTTLQGTVTQSFTYDTLGRLVAADDPDIGPRQMTYDDPGRLVEQVNGVGQVVQYGYDAAGRVTTRALAGGAAYTYTYDDPSRRARGRLARVDEPTGFVEWRYDAFGRVEEVLRTIDGTSATEVYRYAPSGLLLRREHDDGLVLDYAYDPAGRLTRIADVWQALALDAAGRVIDERAGNGIATHYDYDAAGQTDRIDVGSLYEVALQRNEYGAITAVDDLDGAGLDHDATFAYDAGGRLIDARLGAYHFTYAYDALQNMTARTATGPTDIGVLTGTYAYAGPGPRQLTAAGGVAFAWDGAGRQVAQGAWTMAYDGLDQLLRVTTEAGEVSYAYGFDGQRVKTTNPDGSVETWFTPELREHAGARDHWVKVGERLVARITMRPPGAPPAGGVVLPPMPRGLALAALALAILVVALRVRRAAVAALALLLVPSCGWLARSERAVWLRDASTYLHASYGAGPALVTGATGAVVDERRAEPFGQLIQGGAADPHAALNRPRDRTTAWSYHGARWLASASATWSAPDPVAKAPDVEQLASPWELNPYPYVTQNPLLYWDPDGRKGKPLKTLVLFASDVYTGTYEVNGTERRLSITTAQAEAAMKRLFADDAAGGSTVAVQIRTLADVTKALKGGAYDQVVFVTHGGSPGRFLSLPGESKLTVPQHLVAAIQRSGRSVPKHIKFVGCDTRNTKFAAEVSARVAKLKRGVQVTGYGASQKIHTVVDTKTKTFTFEAERRAPRTYVDVPEIPSVLDLDVNDPDLNAGRQ